MDPSKNSPLDMIIQNIIVPPITIRPTVTMSGDNSNEDDLTFKLQEFLKINSRIVNDIQNSDFKSLEEEWYNLQCNHSHYINSTTTGLWLKDSNKQKIRTIKQIRGFMQRIKGK